MKLIRSTEPQSVSVTVPHDKRLRSATASASLIWEHWVINRVFVHKELRGRGLGKLVVAEMLKLIQERGGSLVRVSPGGYDLTYEEQRSFYESCGFVEVEDGLMEMKLTGEPHV